LVKDEDAIITDIEASGTLDRYVKELMYCLLKKKRSGGNALPKAEYRALKTKFIDSPETQG